MRSYSRNQEETLMYEFISLTSQQSSITNNTISFEKRCPIKQISSISLVLGNSLAVQWLGLGLSLPKACVQFLVRKLRSSKNGFKALENRSNSCFFLVEMPPGTKTKNSSWSHWTCRLQSSSDCKSKVYSLLKNNEIQRNPKSAW